MALVVKRTAAAGGADATQTTALGVCGVIESLLTAAGWTQIFDYVTGAPARVPSTVLPLFNSNYSVGDIVTSSGNVYQCITSGTASTAATISGESFDLTDGSVHWRFIATTGGSAKVFQSNGESGNENLYVRLDTNTNTTPSINFHCYQYFDATVKFGFNRLSFGYAASNFHHYTYTAGNTVNYVMVANKDAFQVFTNDSANNRRLFGGGRLNRSPGTIATFFTSNATVTAGNNKTFNFSSGNPITAGYKVDDRVFVVAQQSNSGSPHNGLIPVYAARITALTSSSITIDVAQESTNAGAFIGADPQCLFNWTTGANSDPAGGSTIYFSYRFNNSAVNLWSAQVTPGQGYINTSGTLGLISTGSTEVDPDNRTNRVFLGEIFINDSLSNEIAGILPLFYSNPRTSDALWAIGRTTKLATNFDYVTFPQNTASPAGQRRSCLGPIATSGSSNYSVELYYADSNSLIEGEYVPAMTQVQQQSKSWVTPEARQPTQAVEGTVWVATLISDTQPDLMVDGILQEQRPTNDKTLAGQGSPLRTGGELYPFDTSTTSVGGTGGGFNSGLN